jgi:hypothetical protein
MNKVTLPAILIFLVFLFVFGLTLLFDAIRRLIRGA